MMSDRGGRVAVSPAVFRAWRSSPAFDAVESAVTGTVVIEGDASAVERASATVSRGLFDMLGVRPIRGRVFDANEGRAGSANRVLISEDLWRTTFAGDPAMVGRTVRIDGDAIEARPVAELPMAQRYFLF